MALNAPIQGSAADIIKVAMLRVDEALREQELRSRMLLQVHDELVFEVAPGELEHAAGAGPQGDVRSVPSCACRWRCRIGHRAQLGEAGH